MGLHVIVHDVERGSTEEEASKLSDSTRRLVLPIA